MNRSTFTAFLLVVAGCGSESNKLDVPEGCNPLGGGECVLPIPSSYYMRDDASSPTGVRMDLPDVLPINTNGVRISPAFYNTRDGWSADASILASFPGGVSGDALPSILDIGASLGAGSGTVIIDMMTGERVPHFAELDAQAEILAPGEPEQQAVIIRPAARLKGSHRYAVAIRKAVKARDGGELPIPVGFQAILDNKTTSDARLERIRPGYEDIFARLDAAGVPREDLVVAWDFVTASDASITADLTNARDAAYAAAGDRAANLSFTVEIDEPWGDPEQTLRHLRGTFEAPQLLTEQGGPRALLNRDASGKPAVVAGEVYNADFTVVIPKCTETTFPVPVVVYGHGLMGGLGEVEGGYPRRFAQEACMIIVGTPWRGMSEEDLPTVLLALGELNGMSYVREQLVQGLVNFFILVEQVRGPFAEGIRDAAGNQLIDPERIYYYGISQGGIFGGVFMAYDKTVTRGVLGVPGANYGMMVERSTNWPVYQAVLAGAYEEPLTHQVLLHLIQTQYDYVDPITTYPGIIGVNGDPIPGTPPKQILAQMAIGDAQVPNVSMETAARSAGIPILGPPFYEPYDLPVLDGPLSSALTVWDEHKEPDPPITNSANEEDNDTHGSLRKRTKAIEQIRTFFDTGEIVQTCGEPPPAACDCVDEVTCGPTP